MNWYHSTTRIENVDENERKTSKSSRFTQRNKTVHFLSFEPKICNSFSCARYVVVQALVVLIAFAVHCIAIVLIPWLVRACAIASHFANMSTTNRTFGPIEREEGKKKMANMK